MWRQKLYAFLIRRLLGPYLSKASNLKLESCMEYISLQEGRFVLKDIEFDSIYLSNLLNDIMMKNTTSDSDDNDDNDDDDDVLEVLYVRIDRLIIRLSLSDCNNNMISDDNSTSAIIMSNMYSLGSNNTSTNNNNGSTVALIASVELEGINIGLKPITKNNHATTTSKKKCTISKDKKVNNNSNTTSSASAGGIMSSIVESALNSLRLALKLKDLNIRLYDNNQKNYVELRIKLLSCMDSIIESSSCNNKKEHNLDSLLNKRIEFDSISIHAGGSGNTNVDITRCDNNSSNIVKTQGKGHINLRVITTQQSSSSSKKNKNKGNNMIVQHDIEMVMNFITHVSFQYHTINIINQLYNDIALALATNNNTNNKSSSSSITNNGIKVDHHHIVSANDNYENVKVTSSNINAIEEPLLSNNNNILKNDTIKNNIKRSNENNNETLDEFMNKYLEARHYARTREIRGGILLPSNDDDDNNIPSFDAFFDCNSTSFSHYLSVLHNSTTNIADDDNNNNFDSGGNENSGNTLRTKFHLYLLEMEIIINFNDLLLQQQQQQMMDGSNLNDAMKSSSLSILFHDVNINSNIQSDSNNRTVSFTLDVTSLDLQHLQSINRDDDVPTSFIRFYKESVDTENAIVTSPPNLYTSYYTKSTTITTTKKNKKESSINIDLQPIEIVIRPTLLSSLNTFLLDISSSSASSIDDDNINTITNCDDDNDDDYKTNENNNTVSPENDSMMKISCACSQVLFILPFDNIITNKKIDNENDTTNATSSYYSDILFQRKRYYSAPFVKPISFITPRQQQQYAYMLICDGLNVDLDSAVTTESTSISNNEKTDNTANKFINSIKLRSISFSIIDNNNNDNNNASPLVMNLFGFESEPQTISNDSIIKVQYSNQSSVSTTTDTRNSNAFLSNASSSFPIVPPLSTMKASQPDDDDDDDNNNEKQQNNKKNEPLQQQVEMLKNVKDCCNSIDISIPFCMIDLSIREIHAITQLLSRIKLEWTEGLSSSSLSCSSSSSKLQDENCANNNSLYESDLLLESLGCSSISLASFGTKVGISFQVDQLLFLLQENIDTSSTEKKSTATNSNELKYAYLFILDGLKTHSVIHTSENILCQFRIISRDVTLYEGKSAPTYLPRCTNNHLRPKKLASKVLSNLSETTPIFYRNTLSCPLSLDTPAFHLDVIRKSLNDDDFSVHLFVYDMVYRYQIDCKWMERISCWCHSWNGQGGDNTVLNDNSIEEKEKDEDFEYSDSYVIAFFAISDCMIDYTPPLQRFHRPSRLLLRVSEIRASTNFVTGTPSIVQAYKISVSDLVIYLCNRRYSYNVENSRISCCRNVLSKEKMDVTLSEQNYLLEKMHHESSLEEVLNVMNFVSVLNLDCIDCFVKIASLDTDDLAAAAFYAASHPSHKQANVTLEATFGHLILSVCKDSFSCFVDTFGEWFLRFTSMSKEEIRRLREEAAMAPSEQLRSKLSQVKSESSPTKNNATHNVRKEVKSDLEQSSKILNTNGNQMHEAKTEETSTLFDLIDENMFKNENVGSQGKGIFKYCKSSYSSCRTVETKTSKQEQHDDSTISPLSTIPDNELSATELRKKHGVIEMDDVATALAQSLLIKNFYTVNTATDIEMKCVNRHVRKEPVIRESDKSSAGSSISIHNSTATDSSFDWTTVDWKWSHDHTNIIEPQAEWYDHNHNNNKKQQQHGESPQIHVFPQHIPKLQQQHVADLFFETGTMNAAKFANQKTSPSVNVKVLIKDMTTTLRFYEGMDWEEEQDFLSNGKSKNCRKSELMRDLLETNPNDLYNTTTINLELQEPTRKRRYPCRSSNQYFQCFFSGLKMRLDTFSESPEHQLASIMKLAVSEFFLSETISNSNSSIGYSGNKIIPNKMVGEWVNDLKHPRDSNDGIIMMKTVTMRPACKVSSDGKIMSDESLALLELLPLRCKLNQSALRFLRNFFAYNSPYSSNKKEKGNGNNDDEEDLAEVFFREFRVKPCQLKVDYHPIDVDMKALRDGSYIEVLNVFPLENMELMLDTVEIKNICGWGPAFSEMSSRWMDNICETQMYKFFTDATPFHTITTVGGGMINLALIPFHHRNGSRVGPDLSRAYKDVTQDFASAVALETLNTTSKVTKYMAEVLNKAVSISAMPNDNNYTDNMQHYKSTKLDLPARPRSVPHNVADTVDHAVDSISRGLRSANYTILVLPRKEYQRNGTSGAITSFVRAVPVAVLAPLCGASEAFSYLCVGIRNQMRPDVRREDEACLHGLSD